MHTTTARVAAMASALSLGLTLGLSGSAAADAVAVKDPSDTSHGSDLRAVRVKHTDRSIVVTTRHTNLRRSWRSGSAGAVYLDTDPADPGPEFVFVGGYFVGTDYQLVHTEGFGHKRWGARVDGSYEMKVDYAKERVRMRMSRKALDRPDAVRVSVRVAGTRSDGSSDGLVDWLGEPRSFTPWVDRG